MIIQVEYRLGFQVRVPDGVTLYSPESRNFLAACVRDRIRRLGVGNPGAKPATPKGEPDSYGWAHVSSQPIEERVDR